MGIEIPSLSNGGRERITALLINYLYKYHLFDIYLFTKTNKNRSEYKIPENITRIIVLGSEDIKIKFINKK